MRSLTRRKSGPKVAAKPRFWTDPDVRWEPPAPSRENSGILATRTEAPTQRPSLIERLKRQFLAFLGGK